MQWQQRGRMRPELRRRQLNTMSREQLQTLIICLQNELSASRNVLDRHTVKQVAQVRESSYIPRKNKFSHPRASLLS
jgi:hypothetical protein